MNTTPSGLQFEDTTVGSGDVAKAGQRVTVHYTGWLYNDGVQGAKFDSSKDRNDPFVFPLGAGHVIKGHRWRVGSDHARPAASKREGLVSAPLGLAQQEQDHDAEDEYRHHLQRYPGELCPRPVLGSLDSHLGQGLLSRPQIEEHCVRASGSLLARFQRRVTLLQPDDQRLAIRLSGDRFHFVAVDAGHQLRESYGFWLARSLPELRQRKKNEDCQKQVEQPASDQRWS